jgi:GNAT superfamily N-acetyltransferase
VEELHTLGQIRELCSDPLILWAAQGMGPHVHVWTHRSAVVAAVSGLARRDRAAVTGTVADIATVIQSLSAGPGPRYRPFGDDDTIARLCGAVPGLKPNPPFGWMTTSRAPAGGPGRARLAGDDEQQAIARVLDEALPHSLARPGLPGVTRWWIETDGTGVAACAADAWSAPGVGLLAGVATAARARGRGLGRNVTAAALAALVRDHGSAALMVEADNLAARSLYGSLGMTYRPVRAAVPVPPEASGPDAAAGRAAADTPA